MKSQRWIFFLALATLYFSPSAHALTDTYNQNFNAFQDGSTVQGTDAFSVKAGDPDKAIVQSGDTATGSGKALKLEGAVIPVQVEREASYGGMTPTWVEY